MPIFEPTEALCNMQLSCLDEAGKTSAARVVRVGHGAN